MNACPKCGSSLDWKERCTVCIGMARMQQTIAAAGGFRPAKQWTGESGVDNSVPNGDRE